MHDLVSVIIPVYNVKKYLEQCIISIINQSYKNLEIILVDDGSTDGSSEICDNFAILDKRVSVIHQMNQGTSIARNNGIEKAKGEWIYFIDSDDWVSETLVETLLKLALKYSADLAVCDSIDVDEDGKVLFRVCDSGKETVLEKEKIIYSLISPSLNIRFELWNKIWSRKLIGDVRFLKGQCCEEVHFDRILFLMANKVVHIDKSLHYYRTIRPGNTNSSFKVNKLCVFDEYREWIEELEKKKMKSSIDVIGCITCNTAMALYYTAKETKQDNWICKYLKKEFKSFYNYMEGTKYNSLRTKLFRCSPNLYCIVAKVYKIMKIP